MADYEPPPSVEPYAWVQEERARQAAYEAVAMAAREVLRALDGGGDPLVGYAATAVWRQAALHVLREAVAALPAALDDDEEGPEGV